MQNAEQAMQACMQRQDSWIPEWDQMCVQLTPKHPELGAKLMSHNQFPKFLELCSLKRFGKKVSNHFGAWAVFNCQVAFLNLVGQEEITDVNGTSSLT